MHPMTEDVPKPLLPVAGKPIIQHNIDFLENQMDQIIVVAGYKIEDFKEYFQDTSVKVVEQEKALGTANAALRASEYIEGKTLVFNGDDIYCESIQDLMEKDSGVLAAKSSNPGQYGVFEIEDGKVESIVEKPENPPSNLVNTGCYLVKPSFFELLENVEKSKRGEYEITDALEKYIEKKEVKVVEAEKWLPCSYPWQLVDANQVLMKETDREVNGEVADTARLKGHVKLEEGAVVRENSVVEGPAIIKKGCEVGPGAYIRPGTVLEENVHIGISEVKSSVVCEGSKLPHFNYIGNSYLGKNVNMGGGAKIANLKNSSENVKMMIKGELKDTGMKKLGAVIASGAKIGVNVSIKPGRKIGYRAATDSHEKVSEDLPDNSLLKDGEIHENRD